MLELSVLCRCYKAAKLQCPKCLELGLPKQPSAFCSQDCFKACSITVLLLHKINQCSKTLSILGCSSKQDNGITSESILGGNFLAVSMEHAQAGSQIWAPHMGICNSEGKGQTIQPALLRLDRAPAAHDGVPLQRGGAAPPALLYMPGICYIPAYLAFNYDRCCAGTTKHSAP